MPRLSKIGAAALAAFGWSSGSAGVTASYLVVAGGGGAGATNTSITSSGGSGGGAGGLLTGTTSLNGTTTYTVTVGAGGAGSSSVSSNGSNGANSSFNSLVTSIGGGGGNSTTLANTGSSGGSGGGGGVSSGGAGTVGQGYAGGAGATGGQTFGGGGGGAGGVGSAGTTSSGSGAGGVGVTSSITGTSAYYAGGGGGGAGDGGGIGGAGGLGGGGAGGSSSGTTTGTAGTANTGGGGGGAYSAANATGASGGSGVVIISYPAPQLFWGGFVTTSGGNIIHTFVSSGSLTPITTTVSANYLLVAGGGSGGSDNAGGGGGGGLLSGSTTLTLASSYTVTVGAGGSAPTGVGTNGSQGSNSQFGGLTAAVGGGYGAKYASNGGNGGSGGGSGGWFSSATTAGTATSGQGYAGGAGDYSSVGGGGGGGGGAGAIGGAASGNNGGTGGNGASSSISGSAVTYAGGGGGGTGATSGYTGGAGGTGGGGTGCSNQNNNATSGTANLGGGGGGGGYGNGANLGRQGGSGVVIISYAGQQLFGGGVVTFVNGYTIHTFNTSGTLTPISQLSADYLIVAGGGSGGGQYYGGGGGAGGLLQGSGLAIDTASTYLVTVGAGGASVSSGNGNNGSNSSFSTVPTVALGGGYGTGYNTLTVAGTGGSGGGGAGSYDAVKTAGAGTAGQGNRGGAGYGVAPNPVGTSGGGGGGAGAVGTTPSGSGAANGGIGVASSISGTSVYYAGGGGGGTYSSVTANGGAGGGGTGANSSPATSATANSGGGGGGADDHSGGSASSGSGGSGIVIIRYAGSTQLMSGGSVTITGGYVIHTFTSSGYLTPLTNFNNSLRFRASNSAYLSRTFPTAGNTQKFTESLWFKRGTLGTAQWLGLVTSGNGAYFGCYLNATTNVMSIYVYYTGATWQGLFDTNQVFRDPAAWYHLVLAVDTTQATSTDRVKIYINGSQITSFSASSYPNQNQSLIWNTATTYAINAQNPSGGVYFDGYIAEMNYIDGQQLTPNAFGSFNSYGVWTPVKYGGSYGTNGFYLPFNGSSTSTYAGSFNGSNQYLTVPNNTAFQFGTGDFTVEAWVCLTGSVPANGAHIINKSNSGTIGPFGISVYGGKFNFLSSSNGSSWDIANFFGGNVVNNIWYHVAFVRNGTTLTGYVNGVAVNFSTSSASVYSSTDVVNIGYINYAASYFPGYISNVRIVKGTAVYTSNFTPSTSPLTNITNTSLLTLQNSTIIDNSSNAFTITNNNSVTTGVQYPFITQIFNDQGPAGNNWTPNNISGVYGSTYDLMTDVPTLTSSTVANYATFNPLATSPSNKPTVSNGNLQINGNGGYFQGGVLATMGITSGKYYWETTVTGLYTTNGYAFVGLAPINYVIPSGSDPVTTLPGKSPYYGCNVGFRGPGDTELYVNSGSSPSIISFSAAVGDVIQVAFDADTGKIWYGNNNTWYNSGVPASGTNETATLTTTGYTPFIPCNGAYTSTDGLAVNFGQQPFKYTPPTGFVALNTYNM